MCLSTYHSVECDRILSLWFKILHVNLSCDSFITIEYGRRTLTYLYRIHPRPRDILHSKRLCQSADIRGIFREELHISATQSKQTNLFCTCCSIRISNVHTSTSLETLAQIAACCHTECFACQGLCGQWRNARTQNCHLTFNDIYFFQQQIAHQYNSEFTMCSHFGRIIVKAHKTGN